MTPLARRGRFSRRYTQHRVWDGTLHHIWQPLYTVTGYSSLLFRLFPSSILSCPLPRMNINRALVTTQQLVHYVTVCFWTMLFGPLNLYVSYYRVVRLLLSLGTLVLSFSPYLHVGDPMFTLSLVRTVSPGWLLTTTYLRKMIGSDGSRS